MNQPSPDIDQVRDAIRSVPTGSDGGDGVTEYKFGDRVEAERIDGLRYASVCDGIGAAHVAWQPLGWECAWTSEIDPFPMAVVEQRWGLPNLGDITGITDEQLQQHGPIDLLVGGTPCQSFSLAGLRKGLADPRGNLALVYLGLVERARPQWVVWENVPGVLSSNDGRDFGSFLGALGQLGYGFAYRVLDAQYVRVQSHARAVPQRRRRVFAIGYFGDWRPAAAVLLERESMCGHPPPRRVAGQGLAADAAPCLVASGRRVERTGDTRGQDPVVAFRPRVRARGISHAEEVCPTLMAKATSTSNMHPCVVQPVAHTLRGAGFDASDDGTGRSTPIIAQPFAVGNCLTRRMHKGINTTVDEGQTPVVAGTAVRRLTPRECERLQGFPDDHTAIEYRGKPAADSPRYKALGNSMACNVMSWIGQRIDQEVTT